MEDYKKQEVNQEYAQGKRILKHLTSALECKNKKKQDKWLLKLSDYMDCDFKSVTGQARKEFEEEFYKVSMIRPCQSSITFNFFGVPIERGIFIEQHDINFLENRKNQEKINNSHQKTDLTESIKKIFSVNSRSANTSPSNSKPPSPPAKSKIAKSKSNTNINNHYQQLTDAPPEEKKFTIIPQTKSSPNIKKQYENSQQNEVIINSISSTPKFTKKSEIPVSSMSLPSTDSSPSSFLKETIEVKNQEYVDVIRDLGIISWLKSHQEHCRTLEEKFKLLAHLHFGKDLRKLKGEKEAKALMHFLGMQTLDEKNPDKTDKN